MPVAAAVVSPTPQGFACPAVAAVMPMSRPGQAVAPLASPTRPKCVFHAVVVAPMPIGRPDQALAPRGTPIRRRCACHGANPLQGVVACTSAAPGDPAQRKQLAVAQPSATRSVNALDLIGDPVVEFVDLFATHRLHHDAMAQPGIGRIRSQ